MRRPLCVTVSEASLVILDHLRELSVGTRSLIVDQAIREYAVNHQEELEAKRLALRALVRSSEHSAIEG